MAYDWKASLPRHRPPKGQVQAVFAIKTHSGTRFELAGVFNEAKLLKLWKLAHEASEKEKI